MPELHDLSLLDHALNSMLLLSFVMLLVTNGVQAWHLRYLGREA